MPAPLVSARGINKSFVTRSGRSVQALADIDLEIGRDEFVPLLGPSGCGKSTLLRLIGGIIAPTEGSLSLAGKPVVKSSRDVGMVFQRPVLLPWRTVLDNILFPIEMLGWKLRDYRDEAQRLIELVGLRGF